MNSDLSCRITVPLPGSPPTSFTRPLPSSSQKILATTSSRARHLSPSGSDTLNVAGRHLGLYSVKSRESESQRRTIDPWDIPSSLLLYVFMDTSGILSRTIGVIIIVVERSLL